MLTGTRLRRVIRAIVAGTPTSCGAAMACLEPNAYTRTLDVLAWIGVPTWPVLWHPHGLFLLSLFMSRLIKVVPACSFTARTAAACGL
jgi:hypothetical protein